MYIMLWRKDKLAIKGGGCLFLIDTNYETNIK